MAKAMKAMKAAAPKVMKKKAAMKAMKAMKVMKKKAAMKAMKAMKVSSYQAFKKRKIEEAKKEAAKQAAKDVMAHRLAVKNILVPYIKNLEATNQTSLLHPSYESYKEGMKKAVKAMKVMKKKAAMKAMKAMKVKEKIWVQWRRPNKATIKAMGKKAIKKEHTWMDYVDMLAGVMPWPKQPMKNKAAMKAMKVMETKSAMKAMKVMKKKAAMKAMKVMKKKAAMKAMKVMKKAMKVPKRFFKKAAMKAMKVMETKSAMKAMKVMKKEAAIKTLKVELKDGRVIEIEERYFMTRDAMLIQIYSFVGDADTDDGTNMWDAETKMNEMMHEDKVVCRKVNGDWLYAFCNKGMEVKKKKLASMKVMKKKAAMKAMNGMTRWQMKKDGNGNEKAAVKAMNA